MNYVVGLHAHHCGWALLFHDLQGEPAVGPQSFALLRQRHIGKVFSSNARILPAAMQGVLRHWHSAFK